MKYNRVYLLLSLTFIMILYSCASRKDIIYLQNIDKTTSKIKSVEYTMPTFKVDDRLTINVSAMDPETARPFNLYITSFNTSGFSATGNLQQQSYLVDKNGNINFPRLGEIKITGLNRVDLEKLLEKKIAPFLPDAKVTVQLVNFRISVLGEVNRPGEYIINRDKISVLQAISLAGDLTIHAKRYDIKVIRDTGKELSYHTLDLRDKDILDSPVFYLQQNDILYFEPNKPQVNASASSPTASYIISATGLLITIISILTR